MIITLSDTTTDTACFNLRSILRGLFSLIGAWPLESGLPAYVHNRFNRIVGQLERLLVRYRAGKLRPRQPRRVTAKSGQTRVRSAGRGPALKGKFGWLLPAGKHHAAGFGSQLRTLLEAPGMQEFLATVPQAQRLLRPMCRALAVELAWVKDAPRTPREKKPRKPRRRTYAIASDFNPPFPRGVLAWARREGFGKRPKD